MLADVNAVCVVMLAPYEETAVLFRHVNRKPAVCFVRGKCSIHTLLYDVIVI